MIKVYLNSCRCWCSCISRRCVLQDFISLSVSLLFVFSHSLSTRLSLSLLHTIMSMCIHLYKVTSRNRAMYIKKRNIDFLHSTLHMALKFTLLDLMYNNKNSYALLIIHFNAYNNNLCIFIISHEKKNSLPSNHDTTSCFIRWIINDTYSNING